MPRFNRFRLGQSAAFAMFVFCCQAAGQVTLEIIPASPRYQEPVYARIDQHRPFTGHCIFGASVSMSGANIAIAVESVIDIGCGAPFVVELGQFPTGNYTVQLQNLPGFAGAQFTVGPRMPQGSPWGSGTVSAVDYSGMWWNERESGWGLSISQGPTNQLFVVWFVYDAAGTPTWYTLESGQWRGGGTTYSGWLYRYTGPPFATAFDPNKVVGALVGTGVLSFSDAFTGRLDYSMVGTSGYKEITRLPIE